MLKGKSFFNFILPSSSAWHSNFLLSLSQHFRTFHLIYSLIKVAQEKISHADEDEVWITENLDLADRNES